MRAQHAGVVAGRQPAKVSNLRAWVSGVLTGWGVSQQVVDDAVLAAGELLGNAVRHGQGATMAVEVTWDGQRVHCAVINAGAGMPHVRRAGVWATCGRGLVLVQALAGAWGSEAVPGGRSTWFAMDTGDAT